MKSQIIQTIMVVLFATQSTARIPSFGLQTVASIRDDLPDKAFNINPFDGAVVRNENVTVRIADLSNFPALAGADVQAQINRVNVRSGRSLFRHYHPRGTEVLNVLRGVFEVTFTTGGLSPRVFRNVIKTGQSTVFPQGLVHTSKCISKTNCVFLAVLTSADPGIVPI